MSPSMIEPGQRLQMLVGGATVMVFAVSEAVVPASYWICREEIGGQQRVVAAAVLHPIPAPEAPASEASAAVPQPVATAQIPMAVPHPNLLVEMASADIAA